VEPGKPSVKLEERSVEPGKPSIWGSGILYISRGSIDVITGDVLYFL
jgi:hypothetical protein